MLHCLEHKDHFRTHFHSTYTFKGKFVFILDLGSDDIWRYQVIFALNDCKIWKNPSSYPLQARTSTSGLKYLGYTKLGEGYGPRQGLVDEEKALLYVLNENKPFISVFKILDNGSLKMQSEVKSYKKASHF